MFILTESELGSDKSFPIVFLFALKIDKYQRKISLSKSTIRKAYSHRTKSENKSENFLSFFF